MYVPPDAFALAYVFLNLKPFDSKSIMESPVSSAPLESANKLFVERLYGSRLVSCIDQLEVVSVRFHIINLGLMPVNTKGPSVLPLPV